MTRAPLCHIYWRRRPVLNQAQNAAPFKWPPLIIAIALRSAINRSCSPQTTDWEISHYHPPTLFPIAVAFCNPPTPSLFNNTLLAMCIVFVRRSNNSSLFQKLLLHNRRFTNIQTKIVNCLQTIIVKLIERFRLFIYPLKDYILS